MPREALLTSKTELVKHYFFVVLVFYQVVVSKVKSQLDAKKVKIQKSKKVKVKSASLRLTSTSIT